MPFSSPFAQRNQSRLLRFIKNRKLLIIAGAVFAAVFMITFSSKGLLRRIMLESEVQEKKQEIATLRQDIRELVQKREKLKSDKYAIERVAREVHGMVKPGEVVYHIQVPKAEEQ